MQVRTSVFKKVLALGVAVVFPGAVAWATVNLGHKATDFTLKDTAGKEHKLSSYQGKYVVLEWFNKDCPFVKKVYTTEKEYADKNIQNLQAQAAGKGVVWLTILSGKTAAITPKQEVEYRQERNVKTPFLLDPKGSVGKDFGAKTTPHIFVINPQGDLIYRGAFDDKPSTEVADLKGAKNYVSLALEESMAGKKTLTAADTTPYGCSVKY